MIKQKGQILIDKYGQINITGFVFDGSDGRSSKEDILKYLKRCINIYNIKNNADWNIK